MSHHFYLSQLLLPVQEEISGKHGQHEQAKHYHQKSKATDRADRSEGFLLILTDHDEPAKIRIALLKAGVGKANNPVSTPHVGTNVPSLPTLQSAQSITHPSKFFRLQFHSRVYIRSAHDC